jgi:hypothetical protein
MSSTGSCVKAYVPSWWYNLVGVETLVGGAQLKEVGHCG